MLKENNLFDNLSNEIKTDYDNHSFGCIVGAFLGDSIGSYLEFESNVIEEQIKKAFSMEDSQNGYWNLAPGQCTDDSELALCIAYSLISDKNNLKFPIENIKKSYIEWLESNPFDVGLTIRSAIIVLLENSDLKNEEIYKLVEEENMNSESNGALMRITPLAVWLTASNDINEIQSIVIAESKLTHSSLIVHFASICYVIAIRNLIRSSGNIPETISLIEKEINNNFTELKEWWEIVQKEQFIQSCDLMGWVKIAWTYAFILLKQKVKYEEGIKFILKCGGDTDTNAAIVGGLLGAAVGFKNLPKKNVEILLNCDFSKGNNIRPEIYNPKNLVDLVPKLIIKSKKVFDYEK